MALYASTREQEFAVANWDAIQWQTFLNLQFQAQSQHYKAAYPEADHSIVMLDESPIGRLIVDRGQREIIIVDITLSPERRNAGIGSNLLKTLIAEAAAANKTVRLHVLLTNPAARLYERLGFVRVSDDGVYAEMKLISAAP